MKKRYLFAIFVSLALILGCSNESSDSDKASNFNEITIWAGTKEASVIEMVIPDVDAEELFGYITTKKILDILPVAEHYLNEMNAYIKRKADANDLVVFVDVAENFNKLPDATHHEYINVYPEKFTLRGLISTFGQSIPIWFDPHPRIKGQEEIAKLFEEKLVD